MFLFRIPAPPLHSPFLAFPATVTYPKEGSPLGQWGRCSNSRNLSRSAYLLTYYLLALPVSFLLLSLNIALVDFGMEEKDRDKNQKELTLSDIGWGCTCQSTLAVGYLALHPISTNGCQPPQCSPFQVIQACSVLVGPLLVIYTIKFPTRTSETERMLLLNRTQCYAVVI